MIQIKENGHVYEIRFKYDPCVIALIKNVPGRYWHPQSKIWTIPKDKLGWLIKEFKDTPYEDQIVVQSTESLNVNASLDTTTSIPDIDVSMIPFYVKEGAKPYAHQIDFMKYAIDRQQRGYRSGFILADDQGLAKTCETMNLAIYNKKQHKYKHCLVICCINNAKYNWRQDIIDHSRGAEVPYILGTRFKRDKVSTRSNTGGKEKLADLETGHMYGDTSAPELPYFLIINIEALRSKSGKQYYITDQIIKWINEGKLNMIAIDEVHKNTSPSSLQGKQLLKIKQATGSRAEWIPMTGTPIVNKPTDVFLPLKLVDGHRFSSYYTWCKEFCIYGGYGDHEIVGYKNIPRLKAMLQSNMIRRLKSDVLDLPPKIHYTRYVENTPYQEKLYQDVVSGMRNNKTKILSSLNPLVQFLRLRQVNGSPELVDSDLVVNPSYIKYNAKLQELLEVLEEINERGEKVVVFSNWVEPLRTLYKFVSQKYKTCCFTGTMSDEDKEKHKRVFQNNPKYTVMLGTIDALGTVHTLTAANNVIFYDEPWTPTDKVQAEDRVYRISTTKTVNIYTILSKDTVDDRVHNLLYTKDLVSGYVVDNKLDIHNNPEVFDMLLGDSISK